MSSEKDLREPLVSTEDKKKLEIKPIGFLSLFRYSTTYDRILMLVGSVASLAGGAMMPMFMIFFSEITQIFVPGRREQAKAEGLKIAIKFFVLGGLTWFLNFLGIYCWTITGKRQTIRFKKMYYKVLLDQEVAWYDSNDVNKLSTEISANMVAVEGAIGEKIALLLTTIITSIFGFFYAYFKCWQLSLVLTGFLPLMMIAGVLLMKGIEMKTSISKISYEGASGVAEQAFSSIKTVKSFVAEAFQENRFLESLSEAQRKVVKYIVISSLSFGVMTLIFLGLYSFGFWYSKQLLIWYKDYDSSAIMGTLFCFLIGGGSIGQISPIMKNIAEAKVSAAKLYYLIERQRTLIEPENGTPISDAELISFKNVVFKYQKVELAELANPLEKKEEKDAIEASEQITENEQQKMKSEAIVLNNLSIQFEKGKVTALVGESGSGKSTVIQLLLRYYDPVSGDITVNGISMKDIDIKGLRRRIGYVGQEPVLFSMTIAQNLRLSNSELTDQQIEQILKKANAWQFVSKCEDGINTYVGSNGAQLSGGQKQRIAIARAIAKNPNILVLDEATSALDRKNEKQIQQTLNNLSKGNITTVIVAHRLSTVRNADKIIVLGKGVVLEEGSHENLFAKEGSYYELVKSQMTSDHLHQDKDNQKQKQNETGKENEDSGKTSEDGKEQGKQKKEEKTFSDEQLNGVFGKLFKELKGSYLYLFFGCIAAFLNGLVWPCFNIAFSNLMALMYQAEKNEDEINYYCIVFAVVAAAGGIATFAYMALFGIAGERLVYTLRKKLFIKLLEMPVSFYEKPANTPGGISTRLSQDSYQINNMITGIMGVVCLNVATVSTSLIFAFYYSWQLTLVVLGISPLIAVSGAIHMKVVKGMHEKSQKFEKSAGALISDTVCNIRTVKSFGNDFAFINIFNNKLDELNKLALEKAFSTSLLQGLSRGMVMMVEGFTFWIAAIFFANYTIDDPKAIYIAIFSIIFAAMGVGQNSQFLPDIGKCKVAGASIFEILQSEDQVQSAQKTQKKRKLKELKGNIEFKDVNFKYPERDGLVLKNFNLSIKKGEKVAFVGPSGSGKSTIVQILMRFYPIESGSITVDGHDYLSYNLHNYRRQIGLVSQEPTLFLGTVKSNIVYNTQGKDQTEIERCAKIAHAADFISEMPENYNKEVGQKGSQVSGGQKQRIALARCLIRNPDIFMMDESTSALDADTEKIVFENLKPILKNRTSISIAHRLSTIEDANRIVVMRDGQIIEEGEYNELMAKKENFYRLAKGTN